MSTRLAAALAVAGLSLIALCTGSVWAAENRQADAATACPDAGTEAASFARAESGDRFITLGGDEVRLVGIVVSQSDGDANDEGRLAADREALTSLLDKKEITLGFAGETRDRYGRLVAQVFADGEWVQASLLRAGLALAAPDIATNACADTLLAAEASARRYASGNWNSGRYSVIGLSRLMNEARALAGTFQIIEGTILEAAIVRGRAFLNFGEERQTDFTVTVAPGDMKYFRAQKMDLKTLAGRTVRVRGWLELYNGPNLPISTPAAIELLD